MIIYVDTSALARAYLGDEDDGAELAELIFEGADPVVTSQLSDVEIASAFARAARERVVSASVAERLLRGYTADTSNSGPIGIVALDAETISLAQSYVRRVSVRSLDALHLATAAHFAQKGTEDVRLLSRDARQLQAASALDLAVL